MRAVDDGRDANPVALLVDGVESNKEEGQLQEQLARPNPPHIWVLRATIGKEKVGKIGDVKVKEILRKFRKPLSREHNLAVQKDRDGDVCHKEQNQDVVE